jgi:transposase
MAKTISESFGLHVSRQRVSTLLRQAAITRKRTRTRVVKEASAQQAADHCARFPVDIDPSLLFAIDEMGVSERTSPLYGYSHANTRLIHRRTSGSWKNVSTVAVVGFEGSMRAQQSQRPFNTQTFSAFLSGMDLPEGSHIILDNVAFHRSKTVADVFESRRWTPLFIPPYQPDFNPIENVFSSVKHRVRANLGRGSTVRDAIARAFADPTLPNTIRNCFHHMLGLVRRQLYAP